MTATTITLPYSFDHYSGDHNGPIIWAKENCPSYITNNVKEVYDGGHGRQQFVSGFVVDYYFSEEADAVLFAVRWS